MSNPVSRKGASLNRDEVSEAIDLAIKNEDEKKARVTLPVTFTKRMRFSSSDLHSSTEPVKVIKTDFETIPVTPHQEVLKRLLLQLIRINFRETARIESDEKLQRKHYIVYSMIAIMDAARKYGWRLCRNNGQTYIYNGAFWKVVDREALQAFFGEAAEKVGVSEADARFYQFRVDLTKQFEGQGYLSAPERTDGLTLINFLNGTLVVDGEKQQLYTPSASDFITYQLPFCYDPAAKSPVFTAFLNRVLPDIEKQKVLQEYLGYVFVSSNKLKLEKVLLLYGSGANGKSVFIEVMSAMLGKENVSRFSLESITEAKGYSRAELSTKLLNLSTEISGKMDKGIFKQLASGESVEARHIYGSPFSMDSYAKLLFSTNELPKETESTDGFFRRWLVVSFDETIPEHEQDKELARKIIDSELSGVLNWVIEGLNRLLIQKRFTESEAVKAQVKAFRQQSDSVLMFIEEHNYEPDIKQTKPLKEVFAWYKTYCEESGYRPCSTTTFSGRLKQAGYEVKRLNSGNVVYCKKGS